MMKHIDQVLKLLRTQISNPEEVNDIDETAKEVSSKWVNPLSGGKEETNGLVYGLVQSGKTGVLTAAGARAADEGYRTIIVLTSDNDALYDQTFGRVQEAFPGMEILGKGDFRNADDFIARIKGGTSAIVTTKNTSHLNTIIENLKKGNVRGLSSLIVDDEADQASLNTKESKGDGTISPTNERISDLRRFFDKNTYLQVTATPQALFLQKPDHAFRPKFTVLSHPGHDYVGGEDFFGDDSLLVREFDPNDIVMLAAGSQPSPRLQIPASLMRALDTFMVAATFKREKEADQNCAFLCHVSTKTADHRHIVDLFREYKTSLTHGLRNGDQKMVDRLRYAYNDLATTHQGIANTSFPELVKVIGFFSAGITVKLVNGETDEDVAVRSPYNLFVGGNKLGRGVTIKNLLVSYYGRSPRTPQSDTVLQHARMYGYRRKDIGLLRLFLPPQLHRVFRAINKMEVGLRDMIARSPNSEFRGIYVENSIKPTRKSVLAPGAVGVYSGGGNYNPAQVDRGEGSEAATAKIDDLLKGFANKSFKEKPISEICNLIRNTKPDESESEYVWDADAVAASIEQFAKLKKHNTGYVFVDRDRGLEECRRETQGILSGGEVSMIPSDKIGLFLLRTKESGVKRAAWWPQVRFPTGNYAFAFAI